MVQRIQNNFFILTGTSGTGKSSVLESLHRLGYLCNGETTREVLSKQLSVDGPGLPAKNPLLFVQMMLALSIEQFDASTNTDGPVFFDRGIPDLIAYAQRFGVDPSEFELAARTYRYNKTAFIFPPWKDIFVNDSERRGTFEMYAAFHDRLIETYQVLRFDLVEVPMGSVDERTKFILEKICL